MVEKDKLDQILDKITSLEKGQQSLEKGQKENSDEIRKVGIKVEQLGTDIKAVAEGHSVIRSEMRQGFEGVNKQIAFVDSKVDFLGKKVDGIDRKVDRIDNTLNATAHASYSLLTDVQKDVKEVKEKLEKHIRLPVHA